MFKIQSTYFQTVQKSHEKGLPSQFETWEVNYFLDKLGEREKKQKTTRNYQMVYIVQKLS